MYFICILTFTTLSKCPCYLILVFTTWASILIKYSASKHPTYSNGTNVSNHYVIFEETSKCPRTQFLLLAYLQQIQSNYLLVCVVLFFYFLIFSYTCV